MAYPKQFRKDLQKISSHFCCNETWIEAFHAHGLSLPLKLPEGMQLTNKILSWITWVTWAVIISKQIYPEDTITAQ